MCYVGCVFALVMLVLFWLSREFTWRGKLAATVVYLLTWALLFIEPLAVEIAQLVYALGMYFLMYPSNWLINR